MPEDSGQIKLIDVRLSFPDIWKAKAVQEGSDPKFGAHFLLDKEEHEDQITELKKAIWVLAKGKWAEKAAEMLKKGKLHVCLHEGSDKDYDGYGEANMYVSASSSKRPLIVDRDRSPLAEDDRRPYAGCYVNAIIRLWVQDNQFGKRVNAELLGIQFSKDGEAFGAAPLSEDAFEDLSGGKGKGKGKGKPSESEPDDEEIPI